jgi:Family of unknown function (DUF5767)
MDAELIELSSLDATPSTPSSSITSSFGGGIELLMNDNKLTPKTASASSSGLEDITSLENELNNLVDTNSNSEPSTSVRFSNEDLFSNSVAPSPEITKTWDGYTKINTPSIPSSSSTSTSTSTSTSSKEEILREKFKYLRKLEGLESKGVNLTKKYNMDSPLAEMQGEYEMIMEEKAKQNSVKFQANMLMAIVNGIEFLNGKFDPFDIKLDGWSEQINENLTDYDDVFGELHEKYKNKASLAPELKLMFQLAGSGLMIHMTNTMFKSSLPAMDDILRQNPDLMQQFQNAAVKTMSETSPGFAGFVSEADQGVRPGNNSSRFNTTPVRQDMKGPTGDIAGILSGLKTRTINVEQATTTTTANSSANNSSISLSDIGTGVKKSRRRNKSDKNTVSLDI